MTPIGRKISARSSVVLAAVKGNHRFARTINSTRKGASLQRWHDLVALTKSFTAFVETSGDTCKAHCLAEK
jgi:hypothetical protein